MSKRDKKPGQFISGAHAFHEWQKKKEQKEDERQGEKDIAESVSENNGIGGENGEFDSPDEAAAHFRELRKGFKI